MWARLAEASSVRDEVLERFTRLWSTRLEAARLAKDINSCKQEMSAFGWWFESGVFDAGWALTQMRESPSTRWEDRSRLSGGQTTCDDGRYARGAACWCDEVSWGAAAPIWRGPYGLHAPQRSGRPRRSLVGSPVGSPGKPTVS